MTIHSFSFCAVLACTLFAAPLCAQTENPKPAYPDFPSETPARLQPAATGFDYARREAMIPMRDGVKLHTVILVPNGANDAPILLTRTPYSADHLTANLPSAHLGSALYGYDNATDVIVEGGYIRVVQDIRGKYGSEGDYVMNRPLRGPQNPTPVDEATDTYDTIEWLVRNLPESNGKVGIIGISYDGFLPLMALVHPHPALKVAVPMNPMVDGWMGDDWFHNGAFREQNMPYIYEQEATRSNDAKWWTAHFDDYDEFMSAGSAGELGRRHGLEQVGFWRKILAHPAYDAFWSDQAMDRVLAADFAEEGIKVPMMLVHSLWDQEDIYGAISVYKAVKPLDTGNDKVFLVLGPWHHGQEIEDAASLGAIRFGSDTGTWFRKNVLDPFLAYYLKNRVQDKQITTVTAYESGLNEWQHLPAWPTAPAMKAFRFEAGFRLDDSGAGGVSGGSGARPAASNPADNADSANSDDSGAGGVSGGSGARPAASNPADNAGTANSDDSGAGGVSGGSGARPAASNPADNADSARPANVAAFDEYVSDPSKPVPYRARPSQPIGYDPPLTWPQWLVDDQREASGRTDVLSYTSDILKEPVHITGQAVANLVASTSGTDSDWVVKLIDVYPDEVAGQPGLGGYQLPIAMDIFRGRYREGFATPKAIEAGKPLTYRFALPPANHVFLPGHRIMVQVQSSWFPLYDRNPQTFVPNIFWAKPEEYRKATQRIYHSSTVELPVVERK